ncbi:MAG: FAD:protein FMN transferase [Candidatus Omnitrophota bacterium]
MQSGKCKVRNLKVKVLSFGFTLCALSFAFLCGCQNRQLYKDTRVMMGTFIEVTSPEEKAGSIAFAEIKRVEEILSKYNPQSEISLLNKTGKLKVGPDTMYILQKSKEFWLATNGAFDVTVGPLMDLWGFTTKNYRVPAEEEIEKALLRIGMDKISFNEKNNVVKFNVRGVSLDLGAIAKGYAVDCAVRKLKEAGVTSCLINAGGQIYALGNKFGKPWKVGIREPRKPGIKQYLELEDQAASTSGDYEQYFFNNGSRYAHIFDPKTGYPVQGGVISVTIIAPDGLTADALSTSVFVLGKEKGANLTKRFPGVKAYILQE